MEDGLPLLSISCAAFNQLGEARSFPRKKIANRRIETEAGSSVQTLQNGLKHIRLAPTALYFSQDALRLIVLK